MNYLYRFGILLAVLMLLSCSSSSPMIEEFDWRIIFRDDGRNQYEELMIFARVSDPDDIGDLAQLSLFSGDLVWHFPRNQWQSIIADGAQWWGLPGVTANKNQKIPNVLYTLELLDLSGKSDETTFRVPKSRLDFDDFSWPEIEEVDNVLRYSGNFTDPKIILRSENLVLLEVLPAIDGMVLSNPNAFWWELWLNREENIDGVRMGPYPL